MINIKHGVSKVSSEESVDYVRQDIIDWLNAELTAYGSTKAEIARQLGVTKQAVTRWFGKGIISKENLVKVSQLFNKEPPLNLLSLKSEKIKNPTTYDWCPSARMLVSLMMEDQKTAKGRAKIKAILDIYDIINTAE